MRARLHHGQSYARLEAVPGGLAFVSSYDQALVAAFKLRIPPEARQWDNASKRWLVDAKYGRECAELAETFLGITLDVPRTSATAQPSLRVLRLEYLGRCKARENGEASAFGWVDGSWSTVWPESVLREWFELIPSKPGEKPTLYAILSVKPAAALDEIRGSYRRLARQWHPDVCKESDAAEQFKIITNAYQVLTNEALRRKYDAGLALAGSVNNGQHRSFLAARQDDNLGYRSPLRCGMVLAECHQVLNRAAIDKITMWEDIVRSDGKVMTSSWPYGADNFEVRWS